MATPQKQKHPVYLGIAHLEAWGVNAFTDWLGHFSAHVQLVLSRGTNETESRTSDLLWPSLHIEQQWQQACEWFSNLIITFHNIYNPLHKITIFDTMIALTQGSLHSNQSSLSSAGSSGRGVTPTGALLSG